jgi:hypothetical protein
MFGTGSTAAPGIEETRISYEKEKEAEHELNGIMFQDKQNE